MARYYIRQAVRETVTFTVGGVATDPTTVVMTVKEPDNTETVYTYALSQITKDSTGVYHKDISTDQVGWHFWEMYGTGACEAATQGSFEIVSHFD